MSERPVRWIILFLIVGIAFFAPAPRSRSTPGERTFRIEASQFRFEPGTIAVNPGDRITLEVVSTDVVHGLYIDGYDLSVTADPGQTAELTFAADRTGSFRFRCSVPCGEIHPFMIGKLRVGRNSLLLRAIGLSVAVAAWAIFLYKPNPNRELAGIL